MEKFAIENKVRTELCPLNDEESERIRAEILGVDSYDGRTTDQREAEKIGILSGTLLVRGATEILDC